MNKDQVKGAVKEVAGKVQKNTGDALGNMSQEAKGMAREAEGKVQKNLGNAKEALKDAANESSRDTTTPRKP